VHGIGRPESEVFVGRQPIFNSGLHVVGYELLFRSGGENRAGVTDAEGATASVVMGSLTEIGLERLVGRHSAWINVTREFVLEGLAETMPGPLTVLELLEDQLVDDELIAALTSLKRQGYRIGLDDVICLPGADDLLRVVDYVKLDVRALGRDGLFELAEALKPFRIALLGEKVETHDELAWCREAGCDLFQGYFFCQPEVIRDRKIAAGRLALLEFISTLQDPAVEFAQLEQMIVRDVALSYRLLCYVNSAFFGLRRAISSIQQALVMLGVENLKRWATLSLFASVDGKPQELTVTALVRGRFCELAGAGASAATAGELFTLGLFSVVDALIDAPISEVVAATPFPDEMREALVTRRGPKGLLLACATLLEAGDVEAAAAIHPAAAQLYLEAIVWASEAARSLFDEPATLAA
jgi:EAL and modified HD-GYP domain-containing signal transduction protein